MSFSNDVSEDHESPPSEAISSLEDLAIRRPGQGVSEKAEELRRTEPFRSAGSTSPPSHCRRWDLPQGR